MARKFLYFIAVCIVLVIIGGIALTIWSREATEIAFVPRGDFVEQAGFSTSCLRGSKDSVVVAISNLPTGDLAYLDADYEFRLTNTGNGRR